MKKWIVVEMLRVHSWGYIKINNILMVVINSIIMMIVIMMITMIKMITRKALIKKSRRIFIEIVTSESDKKTFTISFFFSRTFTSISFFKFSYSELFPKPKNAAWSLFISVVFTDLKSVFSFTTSVSILASVCVGNGR